MRQYIPGLAAGLLSFVRRARYGAVLLLLPVIAACTVETSPGYGDGGRPLPPRPQMCTMEYAPVCAERGGARQTFPNACEARTRGYRVLDRGECRRAPPPPPPVRACTREYAPVCGERRGRLQTFANACEADRDGFRVVGRGECRREPEPDRLCTMEYAPVCARRGSTMRTFPNACEARTARFRVVAPGECRR